MVGVLNVTPDSFSDGNKFLKPAAAIKRAKQLFSDGASIVDIGAESTRPGAKALDADEEWSRLEEVLSSLVPLYSGKLSLDTYHPETANKGLDVGEIIINDVTGLNNPAMLALIMKRRPFCIISHLTGTDIQAVHRGELLDDDKPIVEFLLSRAMGLEQSGISRERIILDPGIGFGKTPELNWKLLKFAKRVPDYQVMIGYSRKRFLGEKRMELEPNLEAGKIAKAAGAAYLRVHDVAGHRQLIY